MLNISHHASKGAYIVKLDSSTASIIAGDNPVSKLKEAANSSLAGNTDIQSLAPGDLAIIAENTTVGILATSCQLFLVWDVLSAATLLSFVQAYEDNSKTNRY